MYPRIEKMMLLHDQDRMPAREVMMKDDDFDYLIDFILHHRYLASSDSENDARIHLFETGRTIITACNHLSKGTLFFYSPKIVIDLEKNICEFTAGMRYIDNWHIEDDDCVIRLSYKTYKKQYGYMCECLHGKKVMDRIFYPLHEGKIYSYDMNFPYPTEFRRYVKGRYNKIVNTLQSKRK